MKLSAFCVFCCMLGGISQAATYIWSGAANNGIYGDSGNWTVNGSPNGYYPQHSANDDAVIGQNAGTITWSNSEAFFGDTNTIQIGSGSTLSAVRPRGISMSTPSPWKAMPIWFLNQRTLLGWAATLLSTSERLPPRNTVRGPLLTSPIYGSITTPSISPGNAGHEQPDRKRYH